MLMKATPRRLLGLLSSRLHNNRFTIFLLGLILLTKYSGHHLLGLTKAFDQLGCRGEYFVKSWDQSPG